MFEVTYRVALKCLTRQPDGDLRQSCVRISLRAYLVSKPGVGETVSAPLFEEHKPTRFTVARINHCTHLNPPTALSYVPEFLGDITLIVEDCAHDAEGKISFLAEEHSAEEWEQLFGNTATIGWTVDAYVDIAHLAP